MNNHVLKVFDSDTLFCEQLRILDEQPGCEESLLQSVLKLSSAEGLSLPCRANVDQTQASVLSINTAIDHSEQVQIFMDSCTFLQFFQYLPPANEVAGR